MLNIKELEQQGYENNLTEFLKGFTTEELESIKSRIFVDDIVGVRVKILEALITELEYRKSDEALALRNNESKRI